MSFYAKFVLYVINENMYADKLLLIYMLSYVSLAVDTTPLNMFRGEESWPV